jgi:ABC-2 type transport system ATP-binding protein
MRTRLLCTITALAAAAAPLTAVAVGTTADAAPVRSAVRGAAPVATDTTPGYSRRPITVTVKIGPKGDQPCRVTADLYRPDGVNRRHRAPAILTTNGFGGSKRGAGEVGTALGFVQEGYVVLAYSGLGFGGSGCKIYLDDPDYDGRAGSQMVGVLAGTRSFRTSAGQKRRLEYVARDGRNDPRVGMIGGSYGGQIQFAVAMQDKRVDAIVPEITWHDLPYSLSPNNTSFTSGVRNREPGVHKKIWSTAFFAIGVQQGLENIQSDPARGEGCPNFRDEVCPAKGQLDTLGYLDGDNRALASHASVGSYLDRIHVPTLLVQGQKDTLFNLQEATATFRGLRARGVPTRMIWRTFGHSDATPAAGEYADPRIGHRLTETYLGRRYLAWMNHYVRGNRDANVGPRFSYFRDWVSYDAAKAGRDVTRAYARASSVPARNERLYLSGADALVHDRQAVVDGDASYASVGPAPTSYSETSAVGGQDDPVADGEGTFVSWTSPQLSAPADLVGAPRLTVRLDSPTATATQASGTSGKLILFAKLYDVAPDGTQTLKGRLVSPVRVADVTKLLTVELPGVVHRFATGHRMRLVIAASDFAYAANTAPQQVTVRTSAADPATLSLPIVGRLRF